MKKLFLLTVILLASCNENSISHQFDKDLPDNRWQRKDIHAYEFEITADVKANVSLEMSYVADIAFPDVPVRVTIDGDGLSMEKIIHLNTVDKNSTPLGDCDGDYCDMGFPAFENIALKPGKYKITVGNQFNYEYLPNVIGVGIRVDKSK